MKKDGSPWILSVATLLFAASTWAAPAGALAVSGVNYAPTAQLGVTKLQLNGAGVRQVANGALYTAALYMEKKQSSPEAAISDPGAKRLSVTLLRDVNAREMGNLLSVGLTSNSSDDELAELIPEMVDLGTLIAEQGKLRAGDSFQVEWSRTTGTTVTVLQKGQAKPVVEVFVKPNLMPAMMRIWLGERPADPKLKSALLGLGA